ncbi:MAG TPA: apolipoprotein N-acyltransferase [Acidobacteriota bacterium]|nr:apolipoprotein N-acyltransferase [Acidobacteriota bacterium]
MRIRLGQFWRQVSPMLVQVPRWTWLPLGGLALALAFPSFNWIPLAWAALIPLLSFLIQAPSWKRTAAGHLLFSMPFLGLLLYWIPTVLVTFGGFPWVGALGAFLALLLLLSLLMAPFTVLTRWCAGRSPDLALLCAPALWMLNEIWRNYFVAGGFPWGLLGYTQVSLPWIPMVADIGGVFLVSFMVVAVNAALLAWMRGSPRPLPMLSVGLVAACLLYGAYRTHVGTPQPSSSLTAALVQPDIGLAESRQHYAHKYFEVLPAFYAEALQKDADWFIVSEAQNPYFFGRDFYYTTFWQRQVRDYGLPVLFNSTYLDPQRPGVYYNSAHLIGPGGGAVYRYDKIKLVPFGEYVPWQGVMQFFFSPLVQEVGSFSPGSEMKVGEVEGQDGSLSFATLICFEGIFPQAGRWAVQKGAEVLVNISNDSWYGDSSAPEQLLQMARMRSIETRRPMLRATNTGITARIDPLGRVTERLPSFQEGMLVTRVQGTQAPSPYSQVGEWLNIVIVALALGAAFFWKAKE